LKRFLLLAFTIIFWWPGMVLADAGLPWGVGSADHVAAPSQDPPPNWSLQDFLAILEQVKGHIRESIARQPDLQPFRGLLIMELDGAGLRIELRGLEEGGDSAGANYMTPTRQVMEIIARELGRLPTHLIDVQVRHGNQGGQARSRQTSQVSASGYPGSPCGYRVEFLINEYAGRYGVDPELVKAVVRHESGFNPRAVSPKGAEGLMQLMPGTAAFMGVKDSFDPEQNLAGGIGYLRFCLDRFRHNVPLAVAAYNAGPEQVARYGGIPPFCETQFFVQRVMHSYGRHSPAGIEPAHYSLPLGNYDPPNYAPSATSRRKTRQTSLHLNPTTVIEVRPRKNL
jgi:hypothetical protein